MRIVKSNLEDFEYDIHSLVKAFYPEEEVKVFSSASMPEGETPFLTLKRDEKTLLAELPGEGMGETVPVPADRERLKVKNDLKQLIYRLLSNKTGKKLPWGALTGIRPTKIAMGFLEQGWEDERIVRYMQDTYYAGEEKSRLGLEIARREKALLSRIHYQDGYSLYIGIPFCPTTCLYCSFTSFPIAAWRKRVGDYLTALEKELACTSELFQGKVLDSVYIGGGTPTTLEPEELERLFIKVKTLFNFETVKEFTVEAGRADSITPEKLQVLKRHGVTRISINPQTMNQETLERIGRRHTVEQVVEAFRAARGEGFRNINMDMILGLPGETESDVGRTLQAIEALEPDSLTVHSLAIKRASGMNKWIQEHGVSLLHDTEGAMRLAAASAAGMGMKPYYLYRQKNMAGNLENVGYAREGCYGIYNILIMEEKQDVAALGPGAISKRVFADSRIERRENVKDVGQYIERIEEMLERKRLLFAEKQEDGQEPDGKAGRGEQHGGNH